MKELAELIELWIKKFVEFNISFKVFYLGAVSLITFLIDIGISFFSPGYPREVISYVFFLVFFLFWSFRIILSDLRSDNKEVLSPGDKRIFAVTVFLFLTFLTLWFSQREISFLPVLFSILGFSLILWGVFSLMKKFVFENASVHIYFGILTVISLADLAISFLTNYIFKA
jgi:hypothetical protein